jgi:hypothetical protein
MRLVHLNGEPSSPFFSVPIDRHAAKVFVEIQTVLKKIRRGSFTRAAKIGTILPVRPKR